MRVLVNLVLFLLVAAAFAWWLRPYWGRWKRTFQTMRNTFRFVRQVRDATKTGRFNPRGATDFSAPNPDFSKASNQKTVDVTAKMTIKVGCPVCREMLSEAQIEALRTNSLRCPAMLQRGADCPYYGRSLN